MKSQKNTIAWKLTASLLAFLFILTPYASALAITSNSLQAQGTTQPYNTSGIQNDAQKILQPKTNLNTGALTFDYPIQVSPGRNGLIPDVTISYNSQNLSDQSAIGYGWEFSTQYISRVNKHGTDKLYPNPSFTYSGNFMSSTEGELVQVTQSNPTGNTDIGTYAPKVQNGNFTKYTFDGTTWTATDKKGTTYKFGLTASSMQNDPANQSNVFRWMLEEVRDTNNNYISYTYSHDQGQIYPATINYGGNGTTPGIFTITFNTVPKSNAPKSYETGFCVKTALEIDNIIVSVNGVNDKKYQFNYGTGDNTVRTILQSVQESDLTTNTSLPPTTFSYTTNRNTPTSSLGFTALQTINSNIKIDGCSIGTQSNMPCGAQFADINGDGLPDYVAAAGDFESFGTGKFNYNERITVYLNQGNNTFVDASSSWTLPIRNISNMSLNTTITPHMTFLDVINSAQSYSSMRLVDVNGDGRADIIWQDPPSSGNYNPKCGDQNPWKVYLNTGSGWRYDPMWKAPTSSCTISLANNVTQFVDLNGDGYPDIYVGVYAPYYGGGLQQEVFLNNHNNGWDQANWSFNNNGKNIEWPAVFLSATAESGFTRFADINNDGLPDLIVSIRMDHRGDGSLLPNFDQSKYDIGEWYYVFINTGSQFLYDPTAASFPVNNPAYSTTYTDLTYPPPAPPYTHPSHLVFTDFDEYNSNNQYRYRDYVNNLYDFNGDGEIDLINFGDVYLSQNGLSFAKDSFYSSAIEANGTSEQQAGAAITNYDSMFDINGDGMIDIMHDASQYEGPSVRINQNKPTDILSSIILSTGGRIDVTYKPSTQYKDSNGNLLNPQLPFDVQTVSSIATTDSVTGITSTTQYNYLNGSYFVNPTDNSDRKFAGFSKVIETDSAGNTTTTFYHQGNGSDSAHGEYNDDEWKIGEPYRVEIAGNSGNIYSKTTNKWDDYDLGNGAKFVYLAQTVGYTYDGDSTHRDKADAYTYDNTNGNVIQKTEYGEVLGNDDGTFTDTGSDKFTTNISYATNSSGIFKVSNKNTVDQNSNKVKEANFYYDNLSLGQISLGNQTKGEDWKNGNSYINTQKSYNSLGLVTSNTDADGNVTQYTYDSFNLYPASVTNALNQTTNLIYDYSSGQVTQKTDPNGRVFQTAYDGLGRIISEKQPDLTTPSSLVPKTSYIYTYTPNNVSVQKTDYLDANTSVNSYTYFDGLGRKIQEKKQAENGNFETKDYVYDNLGLLQKESLPYFSSGSSKTASTTTTSLYTNYTYDPMQRVVATTNALGTTTNTYSDWKLTVTDANGKPKDLYKDAYGNLVQVDEHNSGSTYSTYYTYDYLGGLTKITDALGNVRNFTYDGLGRKLTAEDLHSPSDTTFGTYNYTYDDNGNLIQKVDPNSNIINYTYDSLNRELLEKLGDVTKVTNTYDTGTDGIGRLTGILTDALTQTNTYNPLGGLASESKVIKGTTYTTNYDYDRLGNQTLITNPDGSEVKNNYNSAGLLQSVERKESSDSAFADVVSNYDYSPTEQPTTITYANGAVTTNTYDPAQLYRLTSKVTNLSSASDAQNLAYTYDPVGNITQIIDSSNTDTAKTSNYSYDDLYRLTNAAITNVASGQKNYTHTYSYDAIGNILTRTETNGTDPSTTYTYSYDGNTTYANPHAVTSISDGTNTTDYTYDNNGNLLTKGKDSTNTWDYNNHLIQAVSGTNTDVYTYDANGQRIMSTNTKNPTVENPTTPPNTTSAPSIPDTGGSSPDTPAPPDPGATVPTPDPAPIIPPVPAPNNNSDSVASLAPAVVFTGGVDGVAASASITIPASLPANASDHSVTIDGVTIDLGTSALTANQVAAAIASNLFTSKDYSVTNPNGTAILNFTKNTKGSAGNGALTIQDTDYGATAQVVTFAPTAVTAGETFRAILNGTNYDYSVNAGDTIATVVSALAQKLDADSSVGCSADGVKITCTASSPGTIFTFNTAIIPPVAPPLPAPVVTPTPTAPVPLTVNALVVGGGGGGGHQISSQSSSGGGGAGGYQYNTAHTITAQTYTVTVGAGGVGGSYFMNPPTNGSNSTFDNIIAFGGGAGSDWNSNGGKTGASGGGGEASGSWHDNGGVATQGNIGGNGATGMYSAGGGGGSSGAAANATSSTTSNWNKGTNGGLGTSNSITGISVNYAGGGGGGGFMAISLGNGGGGNGGGGYTSTSGTDAMPNTGGGGGGAGAYGSYSGTGGQGGSGIVIISYPTANFINYTVTGGTVTTNGANTVRTFTSSGTLTIVDSRTAPILTTQAVNYVTPYGGIGNATVTADGGSAIIERGITISTSANPTTSNTRFVSSGTTGTFSTAIAGLSPLTLYHARAYAINSIGTNYGNDITFTTLPKDIFTSNQAVANVISSTIRDINSFAGGIDGVPASASLEIPDSLDDNANDHSITVDGVAIDLGTSALTPAEIATKIFVTDFSGGTSYVANGAYIANNSGTDTLTFTRTTSGTSGNSDMLISDGNYTIKNAVITPPAPPDETPAPASPPTTIPPDPAQIPPNQTPTNSLVPNILNLSDSTTLDLSSALISQTPSDVSAEGVNTTLTQSAILNTVTTGDPVVISNSDLPGVTLTIPGGTNIQGGVLWDGHIAPPKINTDSATSSRFQLADKVIEVGSPGNVLILDKPATITLSNSTGTVAYQTGSTTDWITLPTCDGTYDNPVSPSTPNACSISNDTSTKIITFHFSTFETTVTTIYPSMFYNTDGTTPTKHIFANGNEIATITGTGANAIPRYTHTDNLTGSNIITNASDTVDETEDYYPFGGIRIDSGSYSDQRKFIGQEYDEDTGLSYLNARYYDSGIGQFVSEDSQFWGQQNLINPQSFNSYSYANDNPVINIDPNGKLSMSSAGGFINGLGLSVGALVIGGVNTFFHPIQTAQAVGGSVSSAANYVYDFASNPLGVASQTGQGLSSEYFSLMAESDYNASRSVGFFAGIVGSSIVDPEGESGVISEFPRNALVVHGGGLANQTADIINGAISESRIPGVIGFSVQCSSSCTSIEQLGELGQYLKNNELAISTVGEILDAGGNVVKTPGIGEHATVTDLGGEKASSLLQNIYKNPNPLKK